MWDGLRLFSPATYSSLPGWMMPPWDDARLGFPPRAQVVEYLRQYESRYQLDVQRPHVVRAITRDHQQTACWCGLTDWKMTAKFVLSATGTWTRPFWPTYPGGTRLRRTPAAHGAVPEPGGIRRSTGHHRRRRHLGAQILAEVSRTADTTWVTPSPPRFLPDDVNGRVLFAAATARIEALRQGRTHAGVAGLGDVVMVASVRDARARGHVDAHPMFSRLTRRGVAWHDGTALDADAVIVTGFRPELRHLQPLHSATLAGECPSTVHGNSCTG